MAEKIAKLMEARAANPRFPDMAIRINGRSLKRVKRLVLWHVLSMCMEQKAECARRIQPELACSVSIHEVAPTLLVWTTGERLMVVHCCVPCSSYEQEAMASGSLPNPTAAGWPAGNIPWLMTNALPRPYMAMSALRSAVSRVPPPTADQMLRTKKGCQSLARIEGDFPTDCAIDLRVVWVPNILNQLDAAMMSSTAASSITVARKVSFRWPLRSNPPPVGTQCRPSGMMPGTGVIIHPGTVVKSNPEGNSIKLTVEYEGHVEDGDNLCSLHGTKHVVRVVPDEDMPYLSCTREVADLCISPSALLGRQSLGILLAAAQTLADGVGKNPEMDDAALPTEDNDVPRAEPPTYEKSHGERPAKRRRVIQVGSGQSAQIAEALPVPKPVAGSAQLEPPLIPFSAHPREARKELSFDKLATLVEQLSRNCCFKLADGSVTEGVCPSAVVAYCLMPHRAREKLSSTSAQSIRERRHDSNGQPVRKRESRAATMTSTRKVSPARPTATSHLQPGRCCEVLEEMSGSTCEAAT
jgi:hypothetical protein